MPPRLLIGRYAFRLRLPDQGGTAQVYRNGSIALKPHYVKREFCRSLLKQLFIFDCRKIADTVHNRRMFFAFNSNLVPET